MIQEMMQDWWRDVVEYEYSLHVGLIIAVVVVVFGGRYGHRMYVSSRERAAQVLMAEAFEDYSKAFYSSFDKDKATELSSQLFEDAVIALDSVIESHKGSYLIPYTLAFKSNIALEKGNFKEAIELLEESISLMSSTTPGFYLMKEKLALVQLDAGNVATALKDLRDLALIKDNPHADKAAFDLGYYYWSKQDKKNAEESWKLLEVSDKKASKKVSPWLAIAQDKLKQIS